MKELTLNELQKLNLEILSDIHSFCEQNDIMYSLMYGTLIGAIRHKGFIPWDDDIDIIMPRKDFERFINLYQSPDFELVSPNDPNSYILFARVCDTKKTKVIGTYPWYKYNTGVWIDIFPADGVEESEDVFNNRIDRLRIFWQKQLKIRGALRPLKEVKGIELLKLLIKKIIYTKNIKIHNQKHKRIAEQVEFGSTKFWGQLSCIDSSKNNYYKIEDFKTTVLTQFENKQFRIMNGYDNVLRKCYGDYLQLPPINQRKPKQSHMHIYWI